MVFAMQTALRKRVMERALLDKARIPAADADVWHLCQTGFDVLEESSRASVFALANGVLGVRGGLDELAGDHAAILSDAHIANPIHYHESFTGFATSSDMRFAAPSPVQIALEIDGKPFVPGGDAPLAFERKLGLVDGILHRTTSWRIDQDRILHLTVLRLVAPGAGAHCASQIGLQVTGGSADISLSFPLECQELDPSGVDDPRFNRATPLRRISLDESGVEACFRAGDGAQAVDLAMVQAIDVDPAAGKLILDDGRATARFSLDDGAAGMVERHVHYAFGADGPDRARELLQHNRTMGWGGLAEAAQAELARFWAGAAIAISGDSGMERAIRLAMFHLYQSASRDNRHSIAAKGLTGEGYEGHYFWDTEVFVLPALAFLAPELAAPILRYRIGTLDNARRNARQMGHASGALYPWRTIGGDECSAHYPTGAAQYHINADIAYALNLYREATGDAHLVRDAAPMLFETARIWLEIGHFNARRGGAFTIHGVTGPDEYTGLVDNDYYTNAMAARHLAFAATLASEMEQEDPGHFRALAEELSLTPREVEQWRAASAAMWLPVDDKLGIHPQDDSFLDKPVFPFADLPRDRFPLLLHHHPLQLFRHQLCKQGDVVQAMHLAGEDVPLTAKRRDLAFYTPLTTHDSTLSATAFATVSAETGQEAQALDYHHETAYVDLENRHGNTHHGLHMAAMAGSWLVLAMGWGGMRIVKGRLHFRPTCPDGWGSYSFRLRWRGALLEINVSADKTIYRLISGDLPLILDHGREVVPSAAGTVLLRPMVDAVIFDLDGVLTDTAQAHFKAWKRLCDEEGLPFDEHFNENLKGVDRPASLALILEAAGVAADAATRDEMMTRKNKYYREAIAHYGPDDLFPGARELLTDCLAAGLKIGLASASRNARDVVRALGIENLFDTITDAGTIKRGKPDPEIFLATAQELGCDPSRCVGVEDAVAGITAIKGAGMRAIGVGSPHALAAADSVVSEISALDVAVLTTTLPPEERDQLKLEK